MSKLRHVALIVNDPEKSAVFYEQAFGMTRCGKARRGIYMTDGVMNLALLKRESEKERIGVFHFGMWVDDLDKAEESVLANGGSYLGGRPDASLDPDAIAQSYLQVLQQRLTLQHFLLLVRLPKLLILTLMIVPQ